MFNSLNGLLKLFIFKLIILSLISTSDAYHILDTPNITRIKRQSKCSATQFACKSGECIPIYNLCDGKADCPDSSDETIQCQQMSPSCPSFTFRCSYGACVDGDSKCNGERECVDGSDEANCPMNSTSQKCVNKFSCKNGQCINNYNLCDGTQNCEDGSDETIETCSSTPCPHFSFRCAYGACVDGDAKCDGNRDCVDGSDETEMLCGKPPDPQPVKPPITRVGCILPQQPPNGNYNSPGMSTTTFIPGETASIGTVLAYTCNDNYALSTLKQISYVICINKKWNEDFPECIRTCPPRVSESVETKCEYRDKVVNCSLPMIEGTTVAMSCKHNFESTDSSALNPVSVCRGGSWDYNLLKCIPVCGKEAAELETFVINGMPAKIGAFPWHVGMYESLGNKKYEQACGGSLIRVNIVLSAAHCFTDLNTGALRDINLFLVAAGKYYRDLHDERDVHTEQISEVKYIHIPEDYKGIKNNYRDDIAIVVLKTPFKVTHVVQPVCVDWALQYEDEQLFPKSYGDVVGWGFTKADSTPSVELKHLKAPFVSNTECYSVLPATFYSFLTADKFCVGYTNGSSVCKGDSGGGLVFLRKISNRYYIRGIVSSGPKVGHGCDAYKYSLFTKVSVFMKTISRIETENRLE